ARFSSWLYRITFNLAASRQRLLREQWQTVEWEELTSSPLQEQQTMEARACDMRRDLDAALATLNDTQQIVLRLALEEGFSHQEIATIMALPLGTVKTH